MVQINKMQYKDGKGDPRGRLPRYRGNRLHILFYICGTLMQYHFVGVCAQVF